VWKLIQYIFLTQTITGAMSTLTPPIQLEKPDNQVRVDYIQDYASGKLIGGVNHSAKIKKKIL
jgi:hypothetical protein